MTQWIVWAAILMLTNGTGTLASRARNTPSVGYHTVAALASHGTYILGQLIGLDLLIEAINTRDRGLALTVCTVYALASTLGSVIVHWVAMRYFEKGRRRVGAYEG